MYKSPHVASILQTVLSVVAVVGFAVIGADPVLTVFAWLSNLATVCVLTLMVSTAIAIVVYFRRDSHGHGLIRTLLMPLLAAIGLLVVLALAVTNFHVLTGASFHISMTLLSLVPIAGIGGWQAARRLQKRAPALFARLGQDRS